MTPELERLALALVDAGPEGLTRAQLNGAFGGRLSAPRLDALLEGLEARRLVHRWRVSTDGRPATRWALVTCEPVHWTAEDVEAFWRRWCGLFTSWTFACTPRPCNLTGSCVLAGRRGVDLARALEAVERYRLATPAPSISAFPDVLKKALPVPLAGVAE